MKTYVIDLKNGLHKLIYDNKQVTKARITIVNEKESAFDLIVEDGTDYFFGAVTEEK